MFLKTKLFFVFTLCAFLAFGQKAPKYSNEFLSIGVGARSLGMANSCIATINDVNSSYWNPAGLTMINDDLELGLMHSEYFAGIAKYDYLGSAFKLKDSASMAVSIIRFGVDNIPNTLELIDNEGNVRYDRIKSFSVADYAFLISYAKKAKIAGLRYGANVKIIRRKAGDFASAWGFGLDAGLQYDKGNWHFGAVGRDITSTFNSWVFKTDELEETFAITGNEIPENSTEITLPKLLLGGAYSFKITEKFNGLVEIDADATFDGKRNVLLKSDFASVDPHFGFEIGYNNMIYLRGGVGNIQEETDFDGSKNYSIQPNIGLGVKYKNFAIDYALTDVGDQSVAQYSNIFSIRYSIAKTKLSSPE